MRLCTSVTFTGFFSPLVQSETQGKRTRGRLHGPQLHMVQVGLLAFCTKSEIRPSFLLCKLFFAQRKKHGMIICSANSPLERMKRVRGQRFFWFSKKKEKQGWCGGTKSGTRRPKLPKKKMIFQMLISV